MARFGTTARRSARTAHWFPLLLIAVPAAAVDAPIPVSPGQTDDRIDATAMSRVELRCPTFSWGAVAGADAYELVVYELPDGFERPEVWELGGMDGAAPVLRAVVPGSATSWTPSMPDCLEEGTKHAWFVRVAGEELASVWSPPRLFEIQARREVTPEEALKALRRHFGDEELGKLLAADRATQMVLEGASALPGARATAFAARDRGAARPRIEHAAEPTPAALHAGLGSTIGPTVGVRGVTHGSSTGSAGLFGWSTFTGNTGPSYPPPVGVEGRSDGEFGVGVLGRAFVGVSGSSSVPGGRGVTGLASGAGSTRGVSGYVTSPVGSGVFGQNAATSGDAYGVYGQSDSVTGRGVYGTGTFGVYGFGDTGVAGVNDGTFGAGVYAQSDSGLSPAIFAQQLGSGVGLHAKSVSGRPLVLTNGDETEATVFYVDNDGDVFADRTYNCGLEMSCFNTGVGADIAERIDVTEVLEAGDVVEVDPESPGMFRRSRLPFSTLVAGVVSDRAAITLNNNDLADNDDGVRTDDRPLLALAGKVPVKASAENGPIRPGDFLTTASVPGHAARCKGAKRCYGRILGKALEPLEEGTGTVLAWVNLQ